MDELIRVVQLPVIEEQLRAMKEQVDQRVEEAMALVCTDETLAAVRAVRADLNRDFKALEEQRKAVKKAIMEPYERFEKVYNECIRDSIKRVDGKLKDKASQVENVIKGVCEEEMRRYFTELAAAEHVEWLEYERLGLKIDLAAARQKSHAKLREQIAAFVVRVSQDVTAISSMENAEEVMAEYRQCLDMGRALGAVQERRRRIEAERQAAEARRTALAEEQAAVEKVEAAAPPAAIPPAQEAEQVFPRFTFTVRNVTRSQLIKIREFMKQEGIQYE